MRLKKADMALLRNIHGKLICHEESALAQQLGTLLGEHDAKQKDEREANRLRAAANRRAGYAWDSSERPKKSRYYHQGE